MFSDKNCKIADNFLHIFTISHDPYLRSLKLVQENEFIEFITKRKFSDDYFDTKMKNFSLEFDNILESFKSYEFAFQESILFEKLFKKLKELIDKFDLNYENVSLNYQNLIFENNIHIKLMNFLSFYHEIIPQHLAEVIFKILNFFLQKNIGHHSFFFQPDNYKIFTKLKSSFPLEILNLLNDIFSNNNIIIFSKVDLFSLIKNFFYDFIDDEDFFLAEKTLQILKNFLISPEYQIYKFFPEFDLKIALILKECYSTIDFEEIEEFIKNNDTNNKKFHYYLTFFKILDLSTRFRFENIIYVFLKKILPLDKLKNIIRNSSRILDIKTIFFSLFINIYIDPKDCLLNERNLYFDVKPKEMQYDEDVFYDTKYDEIINFVIEEFSIILLENTENFRIFFVNKLVLSCIKIANYFSKFKESDIKRVLKYYKKIEELDFYLLSNHNQFEKFLNIESGKNEDDPNFSNNIRKLSLEMKFTDEKSMIEQFYNYCETIGDYGKFILKKKKTDKKFRSALKRTSTALKIMKIRKDLKIISNKLEDRLESIKLPMEKLEKYFEKYSTNSKKGIIMALCAFYEKNKNLKMGEESSKNIYFQNLNYNSAESQMFSINFCNFIFYILKKTQWNCRNQTNILKFVECLCNCLFISTKSTQKSVLKVMNNDMSVLDKLWIEMKNSINFVR